MKSIKAISVFLGLAIATLMSSPVFAHEYKVGDIEIMHPWARATAATAKSGGAFMTIKNEGATDDRLIGVASDIANMAHLHTTQMENDVMKMRPVDAIDIPAGGSIELKPGSFHVMFMGLKKQLTEGEMAPLTLMFEKAGSVDIEIYITEIGAMNSMDGMNMGN